MSGICEDDEEMKGEVKVEDEEASKDAIKDVVDDKVANAFVVAGASTVVSVSYCASRADMLVVSTKFGAVEVDVVSDGTDDLSNVVGI